MSHKLSWRIDLKEKHTDQVWVCISVCVCMCVYVRVCVYICACICTCRWVKWPSLRKAKMRSCGRVVLDGKLTDSFKSLHPDKQSASADKQSASAWDVSVPPADKHLR